MSNHDVGAGLLVILKESKTHTPKVHNEDHFSKIGFPMISAGEVGAIFTIKDEASVVLRAIAAQMNALQATIDKVALSFKDIKLPPGVATAIGKMDKAMSDAAVSAGKLETSMADIGVAADKGALGAVAGFGRIDAAMATTQGKLASLRSQLNSTGAPHVGGGGWPGAAHGCPVHVEGKESWSWRESRGGGGCGFRSRVGSFLCIRLARTSRTSSRKPGVSFVSFCRARSRR